MMMHLYCATVAWGSRNYANRRIQGSREAGKLCVGGVRGFGKGLVTPSETSSGHQEVAA